MLLWGMVCHDSGNLYRRQRPATDVGGDSRELPVLRLKLPVLWICQGGLNYDV